MAVFLGLNNQPVFVMNDGGGTAHTGADFYFYLVLLNEYNVDPLSKKDIQDFYRIGLNAEEGYVFIVIELENDDRLEKMLCTTEDGKILFDKIRGSVPSFVISDSFLGDIKSTEAVVIQNIEDYDKNHKILFDKMNIHSDDTRRRMIAILKKANRYMNLNVNLFGVGPKFNEMIADLIADLEKKYLYPK